MHPSLPPPPLTLPCDAARPAGRAPGRPPDPLLWRLLDLADGAAERLLPHASGRAVAIGMTVPAVLLVGLLVFGLALVAEQSLHALDPTTFLLGKAYTAENYRLLLTRQHYRELMLRSAGAAFVVSVICLLLGFPYAYVMVRTASATAKKLLLGFVFVPFLLGAVVRGYAWLVVLGRDGLVNGLLAALGIGHLPLMYNLTAVLIGLTQLYLPLAIIVMAPAFTAIDPSIDEAAQSLGAHWLRVLWGVIVPMAAPGLRNAFVIVLTLVFSDMAIPVILGGGRADFIANAIHDAYLEVGDRGIGSALCVAAAAISTGLLALAALAAGALGRRRRP